MPPQDSSTANTPLAPSVEKAYYRKCIELKRRLNQIEAANDEARLRRIRLDRAVTKMRLERAFLLDQLSKRMEVDVDGSEGSADEGLATPPPDRPHRDKRRRHHGTFGGSETAGRGTAGSSAAGATSVQPLSRRNTDTDAREDRSVEHPSEGARHANAIAQDGSFVFVPPTSAGEAEVSAPATSASHAPQPAAAAAASESTSAPQQQQPSHSGIPSPAQLPPPHSLSPLTDAVESKPHFLPPDHVNGGENADREAHSSGINRAEGTVGEVLSAGPTVGEDANGERRIVADEAPSAAPVAMETDRLDGVGDGDASVGGRD